jgi:hypothetical protein
MVCFHLTFLSRREKEILKVDVRNGHDHWCTVRANTVSAVHKNGFQSK